MFSTSVLFFVLFFVCSFGPQLQAVSALPSPLANSLAARGSPFQISSFLDAHNVIRALHNATALEWSTSLAEKAELWADQCQFKHTNGVLSNQLYGENIAAGTGFFPIDSAVATFVADEGQYNPANPSYLHFTQVVWKSTTQLGCAVSQCDGIFDKTLGKASLYVCLYNPVGNVIGQAPNNVQV